jgi:hypothetical protein
VPGRAAAIGGAVVTAALSQRELAQRLLALRVIKDWVAAEDRRLREEAAAGLVVGERVSGAIDPGDPDTLLGFVQLTKARESVGVTDRDAFTEWVAEHAPGEIVTIPAREDVRASFVAAVCASVKAHGGWVTPEGECVPVDGVEVTTGQPTVTVKPTAEADALVAAALASRRLDLMPPALTD